MKKLLKYFPHLLIFIITVTILLLLLKVNNLVDISAPVLLVFRQISIALLIIFAIRKKSLTTWILISMLAGAEFGYDVPSVGQKLQVFSDIFLRLIKTIIAPLLFSTLVVGIAGHADIKQIGRMGWKSLLYFEIAIYTSPFYRPYWGLTYLLLLSYTIYQFGFGKKSTTKQREKLFATIHKYFLITSIANIAWIFAWHYGVIWLSVLIMLILLFFLIKIADVINKEKYSALQTVLVRLPFSIYFGWITVATIANITVFLVSINWNRFGVAESIWTVAVLLIGALIGSVRMLKDKNIYYGLVLVWAYGGIWLKHTSVNGFDKEYTNIITTLIICIAVFLGTIGFLAYRKALSKKLDN